MDLDLSDEYKRLRESQKSLNHFLHSSELAYEFVLTSRDGRLGDSDDAQVIDVLGNARAAAWYPNSKGRPKYMASVRGFREQLRRNQALVCRSVIVHWYGAIEEYLDERARRAFNRPKEKWGRLTKSLHKLRASSGTGSAELVVQADIIRALRNMIVHEPSATLDHQQEWVRKWQNDTVTDLTDSTMSWRLSKSTAQTIASNARGRVLAQALDNRVQQERSGERAAHHAPIEYYLALFAFANLNELAREIDGFVAHMTW